MLLKGLVKIITAILIIYSLFRLSFTYFANNEENKMRAIAEKNVKEKFPNEKSYRQKELEDIEFIRLADSMRAENVVSLLGIDYTYQEVKNKELKLGLDLQGGMSVTLEVGIDELVKSLSNNATNPILLRAIDEANNKKANTEADFITLFGQAFTSQNPGAGLASLFTKVGNSKITPNSTNDEVLGIIRNEAKTAFRRTQTVLEQRINSTGLENANINANEAKGIITVEMAGIQDPVSLRQRLQAAAKLEFYVVRKNLELAPNLNAAHEASVAHFKGTTPEPKDTTQNAADTTKDIAAQDTTATTVKEQTVAGQADSGQSSISDLLAGDSGKIASEEGDSTQMEEGLFSYMMPVINEQNQYMDMPIIGITTKTNASKVMEILNLPSVKSKFPPNTKFIFGEVPGSEYDRNHPKANLGIYAVVVPNTGKAKIEGDKVQSAKFDFQPGTGRPEISLEMTQQGALDWAEMTGANIGKPIAIVLDDYVYSAPNVNDKITGGRSSITGNFTPESGNELAQILEVGKLDAPAKIVQEQVIGSTLGAESIKGGLTAFALSFLVIFALMIVYYNTGGFVANLALVINLIITFGILATMGATLTMPGIAGLVLGIGMAVDVNVIIFERIKEELVLGKSYTEAVDLGYKHSYAPVLDSHFTGIITAIIMLAFGFGAIKGFAVTQLIALILSLFTGIFVTRMITDMYMKRGRHFNYFTGLSRKLFQKANFGFIKARKITYVISAVLILLGVVSFFNGFDYGVEFSGGRSFDIRFAKEYSTTDIRDALRPAFENKAPLVKTIGSGNQFNITTDYLISNTGKENDSLVIGAMLDGLKKANIVPADVDYAHFNSLDYIQKKNTVLPSISEDLKRGAIYATVFSILAIFLYILIRFRKWQYSLATIISLVHDAAIVLAIYSFLRHIVPFSLEIDQHFIAAMLTVIGFSMNDTVIVFDRIREYFRKDKTTDKATVVNKAINSTLSRTVITSLTVFITVLILFIFGGEVLRGFSFAMMIGILAGTYSSIFLASPILVDLDKTNTLAKEEDKEERIRALKAQA
ncbi:MAG: protein translocase subunit SecDF [Taibaiella sp.]|nr:protein translocase subunit SecDF [Taibaiella sp.]